MLVPWTLRTVNGSGRTIWLIWFWITNNWINYFVRCTPSRTVWPWRADVTVRRARICLEISKGTWDRICRTLRTFMIERTYVRSWTSCWFVWWTVIARRAFSRWFGEPWWITIMSGQARQAVWLISTMHRWIVCPSRTWIRIVSCKIWHFVVLIRTIMTDWAWTINLNRFQNMLVVRFKSRVDD